VENPDSGGAGAQAAEQDPSAQSGAAGGQTQEQAESGEQAAAGGLPEDASASGSQPAQDPWAEPAGSVSDAQAAGAEEAGGGVPGGAAGSSPPAGERTRVAMSLPKGQTPEERAAELERVLNGSMVVFDGELMEAQQRARAARRGDAESASEGSTQTDTGGIPDTGSDEAGQAPAGEGPEYGQEGDEEPRFIPRRPETVGAPGQDQNAAIPEDIPDGNDDDIVARQLREAAMAETDPALREKLWDEYRRYKQGTVK